MLDFGENEGEICGRGGCKGTICIEAIEGSCSCHINPPCSFCTDKDFYCDTCGWSLFDEIRELKKAPEYIERQKKLDDYYNEQAKIREERLESFWLKYRGEIPPEKFECITCDHTHFSQKVHGVYPKGSETTDSIRKKVDGTFGGRFEKLTDYSFTFIAYTD